MMRLLLFDIDGTLVDTQGAGRAALERAMAQKGRARAKKERPVGPPPPLEESKRRIADARRKRARLVAQQGPALERAQERMANAVAEHDDALEALEAARIAIEAS